MNRIKQLFSYFESHQILYRDSSFLIGVSGGMDSMVLAHMFHKAQLRFGVAHCNFQLRNEESDIDENFVMDHFSNLKVPCYAIRFNTAEYAIENKLSVQEAARKQRYDFFEDISRKNNFDFIATAHHLNDNVETMLLNLGSGTGLRGIKGIPPINGKIIRPILGLSKQNVSSYARGYGIIFRDDSSNSSNKYMRNALRHKVIPELGNIKPNFLEKCASSMSLLHAQLNIYDFFIAELKKKIVYQHADLIQIDITALMQLPQPYVILFECLQDFGFRNTQCKEMIAAIDKKQSGKFWYSDTYEVLLDRAFFIIRNKDISEEILIVIPEGIKYFKQNNFEITLSKNILLSTELLQGDEILVDGDKISYPMIMRNWKPGDYFHPTGMQGKRKKIKSFLTDLKQTRFEKEAVYVLESNGSIVWVISLRQDEKFLPKEDATNILKIRIAHQKE